MSECIVLFTQLFVTFYLFIIDRKVSELEKVVKIEK